MPESRPNMAGIKVGDPVRAYGGKGGPIDGVVVQICSYNGFLVADRSGRVEPEWFSLSCLHKK